MTQEAQREKPHPYFSIKKYVCKHVLLSILIILFLLLFCVILDCVPVYTNKRCYKIRLVTPSPLCTQVRFNFLFLLLYQANVFYFIALHFICYGIYLLWNTRIFWIQFQVKCYLYYPIFQFAEMWKTGWKLKQKKNKKFKSICWLKKSILYCIMRKTLIYTPNWRHWNLRVEPEKKVDGQRKRTFTPTF